MTTLEDVFMRLEEEATMGQEGTTAAANTQPPAQEPGCFTTTPAADHQGARAFSRIAM